MGKVEAICVSAEKGERKKPVDSAIFRADHGIEGDAHAGALDRQVSVLPAEEIDVVRKNDLSDVKPGDFAENVIVSGLDFPSFGLGTQFRLGSEVVLKITQIGKDCHTPCRIQQITGDCIMPRVGVFCVVENGGEVKTGEEAEVMKVIRVGVFQTVVLTISDRCSRGEAEDTAGPAVKRVLEDSLNAHVYRTEIVPDEEPIITEKLKQYCDGRSIDLVVTVGGTGFSPGDVTPEATRSVVERPAPGLDEAMRAASLSKTPNAVLARGASGIRGSTLIINLPGSERAAVENLQAIIGALPHGLEKLQGDATDCGTQ